MMRARVIVPIACALLFSACGHVRPDAAQARWTLTVSNSVNADALGRPAPLIVRLYALSARDAFDRATFFELYDHDRAVLGQAALERSVLVLKPGEHVQFVQRLDPDTRALAVVAAYQRIDSAKWGAIVDIDPATPRHDVNIAAFFDASAASLTQAPERPADGDGSRAWRWIEPIWKKLTGLIGESG